MGVTRQFYPEDSWKRTRVTRRALRPEEAHEEDRRAPVAGWQSTPARRRRVVVLSAVPFVVDLSSSEVKEALTEEETGTWKPAARAAVSLCARILVAISFSTRCLGRDGMALRKISSVRFDERMLKRMLLAIHSRR